jgi:hypothetical protein
MGFLPIIVAFGGFILLWGLVTNYSISSSKSGVREAASELLSKVSERKELLESINRSVHLPSNLLVESSSAEQIISQERGMRKELDKIKEQLPDQVAQHLTALNTTISNKISLYQQYKRKYNLLVSNLPHKIVATLTGRAPISN